MLQWMKHAAEYAVGTALVLMHLALSGRRSRLVAPQEERAIRRASGSPSH